MGGGNAENGISPGVQTFNIETGFTEEFLYSDLSNPFQHYESVAFLTEKRFFKCDYEVQYEPDDDLIFAEDAGLLIDH